jgi:hypothetical protein
LVLASAGQTEGYGISLLNFIQMCPDGVK